MNSFQKSPLERGYAGNSSDVVNSPPCTNGGSFGQRHLAYKTRNYHNYIKSHVKGYMFIYYIYHIPIIYTWSYIYEDFDIIIHIEQHIVSATYNCVGIS